MPPRPTVQHVDRVVFHGTNLAFDTFDPRHLGRSCDNPTTRLGFFFTDAPEDALNWAVRASTRRRVTIAAPWAPLTAPRVLAARLRLHNPVALSAARFHQYLQTYRTSTIVRHREVWQAKGHDGLIIERGPFTWFVAFDTNSLSEVVEHMAPMGPSFASRTTAAVTVTTAPWPVPVDPEATRVCEPV